MDIALFNQKLEELRAKKYVGYQIYDSTFSYDNPFEMNIQGTDLIFFYGYANLVSTDYIEFDLSLNDGQDIPQYYQFIVTHSSFVPVYDFQHIREFPLHKIKMRPRGWWSLPANRDKTITVKFLVMQNCLLKGN